MNKSNKSNIHKITCIEVNKIKNPDFLANIAFNNFNYLTQFPDFFPSL